jgi:hypothetical protein
VLASLALCAAACGGGAPNYPGATVPTAIVGEPYAVPAVITKPYVQRVLNALEVVLQQVNEAVVDQGTLATSAATYLRAINSPTEYQEQAHALRREIVDRSLNLLQHPGLVSDTVISIVTATPSCIEAATVRNFARVDVNPPPPPHLYITLVPKTPSDDHAGLNPTPWVINFIGTTELGTPPPNQC